MYISAPVHGCIPYRDTQCPSPFYLLKMVFLRRLKLINQPLNINNLYGITNYIGQRTSIEKMRDFIEYIKGV